MKTIELIVVFISVMLIMAVFTCYACVRRLFVSTCVRRLFVPTA
jgi:hypothetical protein